MRKVLMGILTMMSLATLSCEKQEIPVYQKEDSVVSFPKNVIEYSLKGITDPQTDLRISLKLFGPVCDYDREIKIVFPDSSFVDAVRGEDYELVSSMVPAGAMEGEIVLRVRALTQEINSRTIAIAIINDENFPYSVKNLNVAKIHWSKEFVRPTNQHAWQSWFYFFSPCYSRAYHELLYNFFGAEIECSGYTNSARKDPNTLYKGQYWWYSASRDFYAFVKEHDAQHPDDPYMHSADYESYSSYNVSVGDGKKSDVPPTILSTLIVY